MDAENGKLTVFFEEPFWIGVFERISGDKLSVSRVVFGTEPKQTADNPKRRQRNTKNSYRLQVSELSHSRRCKCNIRK